MVLFEDDLRLFKIDWRLMGDYLEFIDDIKGLFDTDRRLIGDNRRWINWKKFVYASSLDTPFIFFYQKKKMKI